MTEYTPPKDDDPRYGLYKFPEDKKMSDQDWARDEVKWHARTYGLSNAFNKNDSPAGPREYAYFFGGPNSKDVERYDRHQMATVLHEPGYTAKVQTLAFRVQDEEITSVHVGYFNLSGKTLRDVIYNNDKSYHYSSAGSRLMELNEEGKLDASDKGSTFFIPKETQSEYLQNIVRGRRATDLENPRAFEVNLKLSSDDPDRHPYIVVGELMRDYLNGYMRQDSKEAQKVIDNLPDGLLEKFGLEVTPKGVINNYITDNNLQDAIEKRVSYDMGTGKDIVHTISTTNLNEP